MKHLGRIAAIVGILTSLWLVWREDPEKVFGMMRAAGPGLVLAALVHVLPMTASACNWRLLINDRKRPSVLSMLRLVWIRESVNGLLPVARLGGEIVSFRILRHRGVPASTAVASLVVDMQLAVISQLYFTLAGIGFLLFHVSPDTLRLVRHLLGGLAVLTPFVIIFAFVQHANPFERLSRLLNRLTANKLAALVGQSTRIDRETKLIWHHRQAVLKFLLFWQPLQFLTTSLELWIALRFLGVRLAFSDAVVFESLIQAISSVAFFMPAGLGVQEGGFMIIGNALGLDPATCLALAGSRRIRDLLIFVPGLFAWHLEESSDKTPTHPVVAIE